MSRGQTIAISGLGLAVLTVWMVQHPYADIVHDSVLYCLLALARLHPDPLAQDIFLRFGSQDRFTLFSPAFAWLVGQVDLAPAAAIMTFISQVALYSCSWLLARRFMSPACALLAVGLLMALPGFYGPAHIFAYNEDFLTPRLPASALALASLSLALEQRMKTAVACLLAAVITHPIIAASGIVMVLLVTLARPRPGRAATFAGSLLLLALLAALLVQQGPFARFDSQWLTLVNYYTSYLFVGHWSFDDWVRLGTQIAVLILGCLFANRPALRALCACAIVCALSGIMLTWIWSDLLHVILPTQMQFWRLTWMPAALSILLSPIIAYECWNSGSVLRRAALIFIGASLLMRAQSGADVSLALGVGSAVIAHRYSQLKYDRYVLICAFGVAALGLGLAAEDGLPRAAWPVAALVGVWWIGERLQKSVWKASALCAATAIACVALAAPAFRAWTRFQYTPASRALYSHWRDKIPTQAEVLWPESPVGVWYLLGRTSYWSHNQVTGFVFSRAAAIELNRRVGVSRDALLASDPAASRPDAPTVKRLLSWVPFSLEGLDPGGLPAICADRNLGYVISASQFNPAAAPPIAPFPDKPNRRFYLYDCKEFRGS